MTNNNSTTLNQQFPNHSVKTILAQWPYIRQTKILAVLKPSSFGAILRAGLTDLRAKRKPNNPITASTILGQPANPPNGQIFSLTHAMGQNGLSQFQNHAEYDVCEDFTEYLR